MRKLVIQIPCFNEEEALPITLAELPRSLPGFTSVEWLIVDDGSSDATAEVARAHGVHHIIRLSNHSGLARAFMAGIGASLRVGADVIVNTDADNQYCAADIPKLVAPILAGEAEIVIGARPIDEIRDFSAVKKLLQRLGSWVVRFVSQTRVPDAPSGFRAFSRDSALKLNVFTNYTYTLETIIQAGSKGAAIAWVPIRTNGELRPSRLVKSIPSYIQRSIITMLRIFMAYSPLKFFMLLSLVPLTIGIGFGIRWILLAHGDPTSHLPSLLAATVFGAVGIQVWILALLADLLSVNRKLLEDIQLRMRTAEHADISAVNAASSREKAGA